jgi:hypothetical protein
MADELPESVPAWLLEVRAPGQGGMVRYFIAAGTQEAAQNAVRPLAGTDTVTILAPVIVPNLAGFYLAPGGVAQIA